MTTVIGLDFETYGAVDLPKHGLHNYINDPTFMPLIGHVVYSRGGTNMHEVFDFVNDMGLATFQLNELLHSDEILVAAHNAPFEKAVLDWLNIPVPWSRFIDTAVLARAFGYGSKLEAAAPQALGVDKMAEGWPLIKLFSMPGKFQEANASLFFDPDIVTAHADEWVTFNNYCRLDAALSLGLAEKLEGQLPLSEYGNTILTNEMNLVGWPVDLDMVEQMQRLYQENLASNLEWFYARHQPDVKPEERLNFNSFKQLKEWCAERGVRARSFDELHVKKMLLAIDKRLDSTSMTNPKRKGLQEVRIMLLLKQELGGASLKKLQAILDQTSEDGRLRDQYLHIGAGQTWRTSGRGVQLQNLKRLNEELLDVALLYEEEPDISNQTLASNIRQCFTASDPNGFLIVGDLASVESRGLGWLAQAKWKTDAFFEGKDMYKVLASKMFNVHYDDVLKPQRQTGKVGELSCGYGAGGGAVKDFAEKMGTILTEHEAHTLVNDWRDTNPEIVAFWSRLDVLLHDVVEKGLLSATMLVGHEGRYFVKVSQIDTPNSLVKQAKGVQSIQVELRDGLGNIGGSTIVQRVFHGCHMVGRNIVYFKPSERKTGDLWKSGYINPKTKRWQDYTIYGGKLAGILTQSLCREMFFHCLRVAKERLRDVSNIEIIGQFHDEIVLNWWPSNQFGAITLDAAKAHLYAAMCTSLVRGFPIDAEVKHDYRYTK